MWNNEIFTARIAMASERKKWMVKNSKTVIEVYMPYQMLSLCSFVTVLQPLTHISPCAGLFTSTAAYFEID